MPKLKRKASEGRAEARKVQAEQKEPKLKQKKPKLKQEKPKPNAPKQKQRVPKKEKAEAVEPKAHITKRLKAATVHIFGRDRNGNEGLAWEVGFFVRPNQVATDFHVVDGSTLKGVKPVGQGTQSAGCAARRTSP